MQRKWYVYELQDPETGLPFYIGKGCGDRLNSHGKNNDRNNSAKLSEIERIGVKNVRRVVVAEFWDEQAAYECEAERIRFTDGLTNIVKNPRRRKQELYLTDYLRKFLITEHTVEFAKQFIQAFPYRFAEGEYADDWNALLDIPVKFLKSKGYEVKYATS